MAHFVRPLALADALDTSRYDVYFCAPARFLPYLRHKPFIVSELKTMPGEHFLANIGKGAPPFPPDVIRDYVRRDCEFIRSIGPDLVVGDMRPSLPISSRLEGAVLRGYHERVLESLRQTSFDHTLHTTHPDCASVPAWSSVPDDRTCGLRHPRGANEPGAGRNLGFPRFLRIYA